MQAKCLNEVECLSLKASMWALGHVSTGAAGFEFLKEACSTQLCEKLIFLAKHCEVYSIRATALHVLGLVGSTKAGADLLFTLGNLKITI